MWRIGRVRTISAVVSLDFRERALRFLAANHPGAFGAGGCLDAAGYAELAQDAGDMHACRFRADIQLGADLCVGAACCQQAQHSEFTVR